jgi:cell division protein FtsL
MNKLLIAAIAALIAFASTGVLADDKTQAQPVDQAKLKAERDAAKAEKAKMTPEQKAAAKKAKATKKQKEETQVEASGNIPSGPQKAQAIKASTEATKNDPKPLATKEAKQKALKEQEKQSSGQ